MLRSHQIARRPARVVYALQQYLMLSMPLLHFMSQAFYVQTDMLIVYDSIDICTHPREIKQRLLTPHFPRQALACMRLTNPDVEAAYPSDAEEHFAEAFCIFGGPFQNRSWKRLMMNE